MGAMILRRRLLLTSATVSLGAAVAGCTVSLPGVGATAPGLAPTAGTAPTAEPVSATQGQPTVTTNQPTATATVTQVVKEPVLAHPPSQVEGGSYFVRLVRDDRGMSVRMLQAIFDVPTGGWFGPETSAAVIAFRTTYGLSSVAVMDDDAWGYLLYEISFGSYGNLVKAVQVRLGQIVDGDFGSQTRAAVVTFQSNAGLVADGVVDAPTWRALLRP